VSVTIRDIAKQVNLSHTTVSRALNNREAINIPTATRQRIIAAAQEMGYRPNLNARGLVTGRTNLIALQVYRLDAPFAMGVARHLQRIAWQDGYEVLVHEFMGNDMNLRSVVDGVLLLDRVFPSSETTPHLREGSPHVALGTFYSEAIDSVGIDLLPASLEAMQLLLCSGRKKIVCIGRWEAQLDVLDGRVNAYRQAMTDAGLLPVWIDATDDTRLHGYEAMRDYLKVNGVPEAIFARNDELAVGCYHALRERGVHIPEDVAIIGCDGVEEVQYLAPPLTTIVQPIQTMCERGWGFLRERMTDPKQERQHQKLLATLERRESH
jgi:LacI family transcriptional regulator